MSIVPEFEAVEMSSHAPFSHHHHWVSPFDSKRFNEFYSPTMRQQARYKGGLGDLYSVEDGDFRWKCDVSGYL
ncbi:hypothetical protein AAVH_40968 [Aphelenchoides avenae]|nr:hypothetical protein AAVH_40968 [Aphelenchus avenae]